MDAVAAADAAAFEVAKTGKAEANLAADAASGRGGEGSGDRGRGFGDRSEGRGGEISGGERSSAVPAVRRTAVAQQRPASSSGSGSNLNMDDYVRSVVKEHDKDGDMMLKGDEQKGLSSKAATADLR